MTHPDRDGADRDRGRDRASPSRSATPSSRVALPAFEGPLQLLLHLIESRQLDVLTVPLAEVADAYVEHLARHPVDAANLSEFVAIAAQLILLKSRRMLPAEPLPPVPDGDRRARRGGAAPPPARVPRPARRGAWRSASATASRRSCAASRASPTCRSCRPSRCRSRCSSTRSTRWRPSRSRWRRPPEIVAREITIGQQIEVLRQALSQGGRVVLQSILAGCRSRTEATVTFLATLELVRRRQVTRRAGRPLRADRDRGDAGAADRDAADDLDAFYEALLFIAERPLTTAELAELGGVPRLQAEAALTALAERLDRGRARHPAPAQRRRVAARHGARGRRAAGRLRGARGGAPLAGGARGAGRGRLSPALHARRRRARPRRRLGLRHPLAAASAPGGRARAARHARPADPVRDDLHVPRALRPDLARRPAAALERGRAAHRADRAEPSPMASERLQKLIARAGLASRRGAEQLDRRRPRPRQRRGGPARRLGRPGSRPDRGRRPPAAGAVARRSTSRSTSRAASSPRRTTSAAAARWWRWWMRGRRAALAGGPARRRVGGAHDPDQRRRLGEPGRSTRATATSASTRRSSRRRRPARCCTQLRDGVTLDDGPARLLAARFAPPPPEVEREPRRGGRVAAGPDRRGPQARGAAALRRRRRERRAPGADADRAARASPDCERASGAAFVRREVAALAGASRVDEPRRSPSTGRPAPARARSATRWRSGSARRFVDTGLMYRALTLAALERGIDLDDGPALGALADELPDRGRAAAARARTIGARPCCLDGRDVTVDVPRPAGRPRGERRQPPRRGARRDARASSAPRPCAATRSWSAATSAPWSCPTRR